MKAGLVVAGPDMTDGPLALLSGSFDERVRKAAALGYSGLELMVRTPAKLDAPSVKHTVASAGLTIPQIVTGELFAADGLCLVHGDPDLRQRSRERVFGVIDLAVSLGAMVNIGRLRGQLRLLGDVADPWGVALEHLQPVFQHAAQRGVRLTLEPLNRYETDFIHTAAEAMRLIDTSGFANVGVMLDTFHMNIEECSFGEALRAARDRLWHIHIADSNRHYPGSGHIDFPSIFRRLDSMGYQGFVSAELLPLPDPDTAAAETMKYLRPFLSL